FFFFFFFFFSTSNVWTSFSVLERKHLKMNNCKPETGAEKRTQQKVEKEEATSQTQLQSLFRTRLIYKKKTTRGQ
ncbi:MAG: hypothetical protein O7D30_11835, partial [Rickettsia endosymbiont of Ixodes persulcatus]|nr:hypothetical protein [Rickettsia endosymbiont of Ixodes persulcatus]